MFLLAALLPGCPLADKPDDSGVAECAEGEGLVSGTATLQGGPDEGMTVYASNAAEDTVEVDVAADGTWSACLAAGEWTIHAELDGGWCGSSWDDINVVAGEPLDGLDLDATCDTAEKPNLYLYPDVPTATSVRLRVARGQRVFASDPPYRGGWRGTALPDGRFAIGQDVAPFLFYEVTLLPGQTAAMQRDEGWCFEPDGAVAGMAARLEDYGFDAVEVDDFVEGWRFDLPPASAYAVYPQRDVAHAAGVAIDPPLRLERLWLLVEEAGACG
ncbi:MAG: hypothetical protein Q8P41_25425, partial [Pseudomonadota bacterium]|nr:hypothetical protein [Pseudomonadota bacterium]